MIKKILGILLIILIFHSCYQKNEDKSNNQIILEETIKESESRMNSDSSSIEDTQAVIENTCNCKMGCGKIQAI